MNRTLKLACVLAGIATAAGCAYEEPLMQPLPQGPGTVAPYYPGPSYGYGYGPGYYGNGQAFYYDYYGYARPGYVVASPYPYYYYRGPTYYCRDANHNGRCDQWRNDGHDGDHDGHHGGQGQGSHGNGQGNGNGEPPYLIRGRDVRNATRSGATPQMPVTTPSSTPQLQASPQSQAASQTQKTPKVQSTPKAPRAQPQAPTGRADPARGRDGDGDRRGRDVRDDPYQRR